MPRPLDGVVLIDKPDGLTSHDVVAAVRRLLPKGTKVGHTGTLDPFATGVLPVLIGKATRLARFLSSDDKRYLATVAFGHGTATYDRTGEATARAAPEAVEALTADTITRALRAFEGVISQNPPAYSAKKQEGVPAYERARRGDLTPPPAAQVVVHRLTLRSWQGGTGHATIVVHCGAGFYVRSLAHDLGVTLGVPAHLHALRRTTAGPFTEADAVPLATLVDSSATLANHVRGVSSLLAEIPFLAVTAAECVAIGHGQTLSIPADRITPALATVPGGGRVRLLDGDDSLLALATRQDAASGDALRLHPDIVLA